MSIYALLIGINIYKYEKNISKLKGCENDVDLFAETLKNRFGKQDDDNYVNIKKLKTTDATRKNVIRNFKSHLIDQAGKDDVAIFYFSGHGAQSFAHPMLREVEPDGLDESLVCYDSRYKKKPEERGEPDLRDKDLSHLLSKLEGTGCKHIAVFLDSCHSGHGTRVIQSDGPSARLTDIDETEHPWQSYLFAEESETPQTIEEAREQLNKLPKHAKHFLMSGCRDDQLSIEQDQGEEGKCHGLFTYALCEALNTIQYPVSYHELRSRVLARIQSRQPSQTPQLDAVGGAKSLEPILGGDHLLPIKLLVTYDKDHWVVNVGAMHGFNQGDELAVFASEQLEDTSSVPKATITQLNSTKSVLKVNEILDEEQQYNAVVIYRNFEKLRFDFNGSDEQLNIIKQSLSKADQSDASKAGNFIEYNTHNPNYQLHFNGGRYYATYPGDFRPLFKKQKYDYEALKQLAIMARWQQKLAIDNPSSFLAKDDLVEITVSYFDSITQKFINKKSEDVVLSYGLQSDGSWVKPKFELKLSLKKSSIKKKLYCTLLWFDGADGFIYGDEASSIKSGFLSNDDGSSVTELVMYDSTAFLANKLHQQGITKVQDYLKIFISEEEFDTNLLTQHGNELHDGSKGVTDQHRSSNSLPSVLDIFAKSVHYRGGPSSEEEDKVKVFDWYTKSIGLTIIRPQEAQSVKSDESIVLASDGSKAIKVEPHPSFKGRLRTINSHDEVSVSSKIEDEGSVYIETDKVGKAVYPKVFAQNTVSSPVSFSDGKDIDMGLDAVEIFLGPSVKGADNVGTVSPNTPLVFTVGEPLQEGECIIPYVYDEDKKFFLPLGKSFTQDGVTKIQVESIPEQIAKSSPGTKSLGRSLKIYFRKLIFQDVLGEADTEIHQLRIPTYDKSNPAARVKEYESDKEIIREKIAESQKVLLVLHGIIGATENLAGFVNHPLDDGSILHGDYDLVLTFDYENLNTPISEIAEALKAKLQDIGITNESGKQVDIVAHSMGGLVSRYYIEHAGGDTIINRLVMVGTSNGGTPYAAVKDKGVELLNAWVYTNVAVVLNGLTSPLVSAAVIGGFMKLLDQIDNNLDQMAPDSDFLKILLASTQPDTNYSLIAGFTHEEHVSVDQNDSRLSRLFQYLSGHLKLKAYEQLTERLFKESNDIAASDSSMNSFNPDWQEAVSVAKVSCDHLSYFSDVEAINLIAGQLRK